MGSEMCIRDRLAAKAARKQLVFVSNKSGRDLQPKEIEQSIVNKQSVVYHSSCKMCDANYVG